MVNASDCRSDSWGFDSLPQLSPGAGPRLAAREGLRPWVGAGRRSDADAGRPG
jgi:hypothetical protein